MLAISHGFYRFSLAVGDIVAMARLHFSPYALYGEVGAISPTLICDLNEEKNLLAKQTQALTLYRFYGSCLSQVLTALAYMVVLYDEKRETTRRTGSENTYMSAPTLANQLIDTT